MREASIPQKEWSSRLISLLTGKALTAFHNNVPQAVMDSYSDLKDALMKPWVFHSSSVGGLSGHSPGSLEKPLKRQFGGSRQSTIAWCTSARRIRITGGRCWQAAIYLHILQRLLTTSEYESQKIPSTWRIWCSSISMESGHGAIGSSSRADLCNESTLLICMATNHYIVACILACTLHYAMLICSASAL